MCFGINRPPAKNVATLSINFTSLSPFSVISTHCSLFWAQKREQSPAFCDLGVGIYVVAHTNYGINANRHKHPHRWQRGLIPQFYSIPPLKKATPTPTQHPSRSRKTCILRFRIVWASDLIILNRALPVIVFIFISKPHILFAIYSYNLAFIESGLNLLYLISNNKS